MVFSLYYSPGGTLQNCFSITHVTSTVLKLVNFIQTKGMNQTVHIPSTKSGVECTDVPYHISIQWLSLGKVVKRAWDLQEEILMFMGLKDKDLMFPQLKHENWETDLAFLVDMLEHLNNFNVTLQSK
jgi:hypothetical protein